jgi:hypothetical protein
MAHCRGRMADKQDTWLLGSRRRSLQRPCVVPLVGQCIAAGVPEHVRVSLESQFGLLSRPLDHSGETGGGEG